MSNPKGAGRKTVITKNVLQKLEFAFSAGCTDLEASLYAGIGKSTLYNYQNENPKFVERKNQLKESLVLEARLLVLAAITKGLKYKDRRDVATARWYLERKKKDEFSDRKEITGKEGRAVILELSTNLKSDYGNLPEDIERHQLPRHPGQQGLALESPIHDQGQTGEFSTVPDELRTDRTFEGTPVAPTEPNR